MEEIKNKLNEIITDIENKTEYINYDDVINKDDDYINSIIKHNNNIIINEMKENFKDYEKITIIGKGETAKYIEDSIGINQSIIFTNKKYLFMNDFESLFGIEEYIKDIKYIFFPDFLHINTEPSKDFNFKNVILYLNQYNFKGKIFIYQIQTTLSEKKLDEYNFDSRTSTDIPIFIFTKFINIKKYELYGCGKSVLYHKDLLNLNFSYINSDEKHKEYFNCYLKDYFRNFNSSLSLYHHINMNDFLEKISKELEIIIELN